MDICFVKDCDDYHYERVIYEESDEESDEEEYDDGPRLPVSVGADDEKSGNDNNDSEDIYFNNYKDVKALSNFNKITKMHIYNDSVNQIGKQIDVYPDNLMAFHISYNVNYTFGILPDTLTILSCRGCNLTALPVLPKFLEELDCSLNKLIDLPILPKSLKALYCAGNNIKEIPKLLDGIEVAKFSKCKIKKIPKLPDSLLELDISHCPIKESFSLPPNLKRFDCNNCKLTELPKIPESLVILVCNTNKISSLDCIPKKGNIENVTCHHNPIKEIPHWLIALDCYIEYNNTPMYDYIHSLSKEEWYVRYMDLKERTIGLPLEKPIENPQ